MGTFYQDGLAMLTLTLTCPVCQVSSQLNCSFFSPFPYYTQTTLKNQKAIFCLHKMNNYINLECFCIRFIYPLFIFCFELKFLFHSNCCSFAHTSLTHSHHEEARECVFILTLESALGPSIMFLVLVLETVIFPRSPRNYQT